MADPFDDEIRRRARAARTEIEQQVNDEPAVVESRLADPEPAGVSTRPNRRLVAIGGSIAAAAVAIIGGIVLLGGHDATIETAEPSTTTAITTPSTAPTTTPDIIEPVTSTTTTATTAPVSQPASSTTTPLIVVDPGVIGVLADDPPPPVALELMGSVPLAGATDPQTAIGDLGVVIGRPDSIATFDFSGQRRTVPLADELVDNLWLVAYGPGDIVYGLTRASAGFEMVAVPLIGRRPGQVIARSEPLDAATWGELPTSPFGHGVDGIVARVHEVERTVMAYVDIDGAPVDLGGHVPLFATVDDQLVVSTTSIDQSWTLSINRTRTPTATIAGPPAPAPTTGSRIVYPTYLEPLGDEQFASPVIAVLQPDGTGRWFSIPDGFDYAASDSTGTVFTRLVGDDLEVALMAGGAKPWRRLPWEGTRVERTCDDETGCTQLAVDLDGSMVTYDPATRTLTRHITPPVTTTLAEGYGDIYIEVLGPDRVVYLNIDPAVPGDAAADLVAVTLDGSDAGRELGRWDNVTDRVGDSDLVATRDGLVWVSCCGGDARRPTSDARIVLPWVGRSGEPVEMRFDPIVVEITSATRLTVERGERAWAFDIPEGIFLRGMPSIVPTFDGGFIGSLFGQSPLIVRGWPDGTVDQQAIENELDGFGWPVLDPAGRVLFEDGTRFVRVQPFDERREQWDGELDIDVEGTGAVTIRRQHSRVDPAWGADPVAFADAIAGTVAVNERRTIEVVDRSATSVVVSVTTTNYFDDSVFGTRLLLTIDVADGGPTLREGTWSNVCQPGRGHQTFESGLCR